MTWYGMTGLEERRDGRLPALCVERSAGTKADGSLRTPIHFWRQQEHEEETKRYRGFVVLRGCAGGFVTEKDDHCCCLVEGRWCGGGDGHLRRTR